MPDPTWYPRLRGELEHWRGQPWELGVLDCRLFVARAYDSLYGVEDPMPPALLDPGAMTDRAAAYAAYKALTERYPCARIAADINIVEPGDAVVFAKGQDTGFVGHVAVVGMRRGELWHAQPKQGVAVTSWGALRPILLHAFRMLEKDTW
jgi:hypothetical protein